MRIDERAIGVLNFYRSPTKAISLYKRAVETYRKFKATAGGGGTRRREREGLSRSKAHDTAADVPFNFGAPVDFF